MTLIKSLIARVQKTQHGFTDILKAAQEVYSGHSSAETLSLAKELFAFEIHQARCLAAFLLGMLAAKSKESFGFLRKQVTSDKDWRVQEILAKAFDQYCKDTGYEKALPAIKDWLADENPNVRRAVTEGLRIWTSRDYFREHPDVAIKLLSQLKADESVYVRKSVGNALRDISRRHKDLIRAELQKWDTSDKRVRQTYKLAHKFLE
ncbi:MAG: HEAT repeat domain-containing protein [Chloroflexi bacterium]|nr:HEAT repeat domain-containing protein [Chloroflexota bacterium]